MTIVTGRVIVRFNDFPELAGRVEDAVEDALDQSVQVTIQVADPLTRVDTGALKGGKQINRTSESAEVIWTADYAAYQNFGTYKMSGTHFADIGAEAGARALVSALRGMF